MIVQHALIVCIILAFVCIVYSLMIREQLNKEINELNK